LFSSRKKWRKLKTRLQQTLSFYFDDDFFEKYQSRIHLVKGDITQKNIGMSAADARKISKNISTVINSAALVKHYGLKADFNSINVIGVKNIIAFCQKHDKRLMHISTISVSGFGDKEESLSTWDEQESSKTFSENDLYIGQNLKNIYGITKYKAEVLVLKAIATGLDAQILRLGNITNRYSDGVFQKNIDDNAFAKRIQSFINIGAFPKEMLSHEVELTPVDLAARAIIKILKHSSSYNVFHIYNNNLLPLSKLYKTLTKRGVELVPVKSNLMTVIIKGLLVDEDTKNLIHGLVQDINKDKTLVYNSNIRLNSKFTNKYLLRAGFKWPKCRKSYINKCFNYFEKVGFIKIKSDSKK